MHPANTICIKCNDPYGNRTRVTAVKGRCLNRLTKGPVSAISNRWYASLSRRTRLYNFSVNTETPRVGLEPTTQRLTAVCSTDWAIEEYEIYNKTTYLIRHLYHMHCMWIPSKPLRISPRPISTCQLNVLPRLHSKPINLVVFKGSYSCDGISHLEGGFTLRCLQRLSLPDLATRPWA